MYGIILGLENFCEDVEFMLNRKVGFYWRICWGIINPVVLIGIFIYFILTMERLQHEKIDFPDIALGKMKLPHYISG